MFISGIFEEQKIILKERRSFHFFVFLVGASMGLLYGWAAILHILLSGNPKIGYSQKQISGFGFTFMCSAMLGSQPLSFLLSLPRFSRRLLNEAPLFRWFLCDARGRTPKTKGKRPLF